MIGEPLSLAGADHVRATRRPLAADTTSPGVFGMSSARTVRLSENWPKPWMFYALIRKV